MSETLYSCIMLDIINVLLSLIRYGLSCCYVALKQASQGTSHGHSI